MSDDTREPDGGQLGWIVSWRCPKEVPLPALRDALRTAGMDTDLAGDMSTQNALRRALRDMNESRVIRKLRVDGDNIHFQITHEERQETKIEYWREAEVCLEGSGNVTCDVPELADQARLLLQEHLAKRLTTDLTRLLQRVFDKRKADLVPIREQGGAYFVPEHCHELVDQSRRLLHAIGGKLRSFAVRLGCGDTKASVAESLSQYLAGLVGEFRESLEGCGRGGTSHSFIIGKSYLIRCVTHYYVGRLAAVTDTDLVLEDASWVADTGRFHTALSSGARPGARFGKWTVISFVERKKGRDYWLCRCECGYEKTVAQNRIGRSGSCKGCSKTTHGATRGKKRAAEHVGRGRSVASGSRRPDLRDAIRGAIETKPD